MKKRGYLTFILLVIVLTINSCGIVKRICYKSINRLEKDTVTFSSLPIEIKEYFFYYRKIPYLERQDKDKLFTCNTAYEYEIEKVRLFTWDDILISHYLLIDKTNNIIYRLNYETALFPVIVFDREIFIPTDNNIFSKLGRYERGEIELTFKRYFLESDGRFRRKTKVKDTSKRMME